MSLVGRTCVARDNKDRYGYRHRSDDSYQVGESMPGDVGDSKGTFHDRANSDANVIVDGKVQSKESYKRSVKETSSSSGTDSTHWSQKKKKKSKSQKQSSSKKKYQGPKVSQDEIVGKTVEVEIEHDGGTLDTMARYKNHQIHIEGGIPGETRRVKLEKGKGYLVGRPIQLKE